MTDRGDIIEQIPRHIKDIERGFYQQRVIESSDTNCLNMFRMSRELFIQAFFIAKDQGPTTSTQHVTMNDQLAVFLYIVGHNDRNRFLEVNFIRSCETISRYFQQTLRAIGELHRDYICGPSNNTDEKNIGDPRFRNYFKVSLWFVQN